jgi:Mg2+ and Co2+ transporter CorA
MDLDAAQLSSLATSLGDLVDRVSALAETFQASPREDVAADLYDVERNLQAAHRRLRALVTKLT